MDSSFGYDLCYTVIMETETLTMICRRCKIEKPIDEFNWRFAGKTRQKYCKLCQSLYTRAHYKNNPGPYKERARNSAKRNRKYLDEILALSKCIDCGENDPVVLEFDHIRGKKECEITRMADSGVSIKKLDEEISKCEIRCANCHKKRHYKKFFDIRQASYQEQNLPL
jgi:hypothetical protein